MQPVPYSHRLHAGELGLDCRYCHTGVEESALAGLPTAPTCMNCHNAVKPQSTLLAAVREAADSGEALPWVRVHRLPDHVFFNHAAHVVRGVACDTCHGRVDTMETVRHEQALSMAFCVDCHRAPDASLRDPALATTLGWVHPGGPAAQRAEGARLAREWKIKAPVACSGCHR